MLSFGLGAKSFARATVVCSLLAMLPGCASFYVDSAIQDLKPEEKVAVANPQPVQFLFEFQTKGVPNANGADELKPFVLDTVQTSGLFSQAGADPVSSGALLHITLNNVPLTDDAYAKGFVTGLTLGLAGNTVGDGYICTVTYQAHPGAAEITKQERNAIYTSLGASNGPEQKAEKEPNVLKAVEVMTRRTVALSLNELAKDPAFHQ